MSVDYDSSLDREIIVGDIILINSNNIILLCILYRYMD